MSWPRCRFTTHSNQLSPPLPHSNLAWTSCSSGNSSSHLQSIALYRIHGSVRVCVVWAAFSPDYICLMFVSCSKGPIPVAHRPDIPLFCERNCHFHFLCLFICIYLHPCTPIATQSVSCSHGFAFLYGVCVLLLFMST